MPNFQELNGISILFRIGLAIIVGGLIGLERGSKAQAAGFRTYILVCLGSTMIMMTNQFVSQHYQLGDPTRMGAQVISGIGFIGAGTIMVTNNNRIRGLTTAAGIWTAASIGLAIGIGFYEGAILCAGAVLLIMTVFQPFKIYLQKRSRIVEIYLILSSLEAYNRFLIFCTTNHYHILSIQNGIGETDTLYKDELVDDEIGCFISFKLSETFNHIKFIQDLSQQPGVKYIEELK